MRQREQETKTNCKAAQDRKAGDASTSQLRASQESQMVPQSERATVGLATQEAIETGSSATGSVPVQASHPLLKLQRQYGNRYVQRAVEIMRKEEDKDEVTPEVEAAINRKRGGGQSLDSGVCNQLERAFAADFKGVRVHTDTEADNLTRELNAHAFTTGKDIFFREGAYNPNSTSGRELLAHELTHVVQQENAHVPQKLGISEPSDVSEREAEQVSQDISRTEQREKMVKGFRSIHRTQLNLQRRTFKIPYPWEKPPWDFTLIITGDFETTSSDFYQFKQACWSGIKMAFKSVEYIKAKDHLNEIRGQRRSNIELKYRSPSGEFLEIKKEAEEKAKAFFASVIPLKGKREGASEKGSVVPGEAVPVPKHETSQGKTLDKPIYEKIIISGEGESIKLFEVAVKDIWTRLEIAKNHWEAIEPDVRQGFAEFFASYTGELLSVAKNSPAEWWIYSAKCLRNAESAMNRGQRDAAMSSLREAVRFFNAYNQAVKNYNKDVIVGAERGKWFLEMSQLLLEFVATGGVSTWAQGAKAGTQLGIGVGTAAGLKAHTELGKQVGEIEFGLRKSFDVGSIVEEAAWSAATSLIGGKLSDAFLSGLSRKLLVTELRGGGEILTHTGFQKFLAEYLGGTGSNILVKSIRKIANQKKGRTLTGEEFCKILIEELLNSGIKGDFMGWFKAKSNVR